MRSSGLLSTAFYPKSESFHLFHLTPWQHRCSLSSTLRSAFTEQTHIQTHCHTVCVLRSHSLQDTRTTTHVCTRWNTHTNSHARTHTLTSEHPYPHHHNRANTTHNAIYLLHKHVHGSHTQTHSPIFRMWLMKTRIFRQTLLRFSEKSELIHFGPSLNPDHFAFTPVYVSVFQSTLIWSARVHSNGSTGLPHVCALSDLGLSGCDPHRSLSANTCVRISRYGGDDPRHAPWLTAIATTHPPLTDACSRYNVSLLNVDPPIYQFEDFLSAEEADGLAALAAGRFQKSTTGLNRDRK